MFTKRQHFIITKVINQTNGIKGNLLAEMLKVSDRTIRNDVVEVNHILKNYQCSILSSRQKGYYVESKQSEIIQELLKNEKIESDHQDRVYEVLGYLLFGNESITVDDLADNLYVSDQTILLDLNKIQKSLLIDYSLDLFDIKSNIIVLKQNELGIRMLFAKLSKKEILLSQSEQPQHLKAIIKDFYCEEEFKDILNKIGLYYHENKITLSSDSLYMLSWVLYFIIIRNENGYIMKDDYSSDIRNNFMLNITEYLKENDYTIFQKDQRFLVNFMSTLGVMESNHNILIISDVTRKIISEFTDDVKNKYGFDIKQNKELYENMTLHIEIMIHRLKEHFPMTNPILEEVKSKYPYSYEIAMLSVPTIYKYENEWLNDDEISYLALYIQSYIEMIDVKVKAILVTGSGKGLTKLIKQWIDKNFADLIDIFMYIPSYKIDNITNLEYDVIISTVILNDIKKPIVTINGIPDKRDKENINAFIKKLNIERNMIRTIKNTFSKQLFCRYEKKVKFNQVIEDLSHLLYEENVILSEKQFVKSVIQREPLYPTKLCEGFMIPHPLQELSLKNAVAVAIVNEGLENDDTMKVIFLLALNSLDNKEIEIFFKLISLLTENFENLLLISKSNENNLIDNLIEIAERND